MRDSLRHRSMRLPRSSPYRSLTTVVALLVLALLLLLLDQSGRLTPLRSEAESWLSPALAGLQRVGDRIGGVGHELSDVQQLRERNTTLEGQVSQLQAARIENEALRQEVEQLRRQLEIQQQQPWKLLPVDVAVVSPDAGRHVMVIGAGSEHGVQPGMALIGQEGSSPPSLVGVVEAVAPRSARVLLITDYSNEISVKVYHSGVALDGIVQGQLQRGSWLRLEDVERSVPLAPGDQVVTAGLTAQMDLQLPHAAVPPNIAVGIVERVRVEGRSQVADLRPFVNPEQVRYAWIILSHAD